MGGMTDPTTDDFPTEPIQVGDGDSGEQSQIELSETQPSTVNLDDDDAGYAETAAMPAAMPAAIPAGGQDGETPAPVFEDLPAESTRRGISMRLLTFLGLLTLLVIAGLSAYLGYTSGIDVRSRAQQSFTIASLQEQYNLGMQDVEEKNWDRARQRFEYIIRNQPDFPDVTNQLAMVYLHLNTTATPTAAPIPTLTPTPDTRGIEERFKQGEEYQFNSDWDNAIETLLLLRRDDPEYQAVKIDGMLYLALRNRGMDKIGKQADLEGGIYDLALAERFGPIDAEALSYLNWARLYITGASFWELNWEEAVNYFSQIAAQLPYLRDGSGMTSTERYRQALIGLGISRLNTKPCTAIEPLQQALSMAADEEAANALDEANRLCSGGGRQKEGDSDDAPPTEEAPPTPEIVVPPTEEPTPYP
jgi:tetratricopeptide (TPR) repeat protein